MSSAHPLPYDFSDDDLLRFSRQILLDEVGIEGQSRLQQAHALVLGLGGLGAPAALYLAAAGIGRLTLADHDTVELSNLQRQVIHTQDRIGQLKVDSARAGLLAVRDTVDIRTVPLKLDEAALPGLLEGVDVALDCSDNFKTRQALNAACVARGIPLVSGSAVRWDGQLAVFDTREAQAPCYACLFPPHLPPSDIACATMGVISPLVGTIGSLQALEAVKCLLGHPGLPPANGVLHMLDARQLRWQQVKVPRNPACPVCGARGCAA